MSRLEECKKIDIVGFLGSQGIQPVKRNGNKAWFLSPLHNESNPSFIVYLDSNRWCDMGISLKTGDALDLVQELNRCSAVEAMDIILGEKELEKFEAVEVNTEPLISVTKVVDSYIHPALIMYLQSRMIPETIYKRKTKQVHYSFKENADKSYFAVGFANDAGGWELRNDKHKYCVSPKNITTYGEGKTLTLFEGFINYFSALAYFGIDEFEGRTIVMNGLGMLFRLLPTLNQYEKINCFLDWGVGGDSSMNMIRSVCGLEKVIDGRCLYESHEDFNDFWIRINTKN
jgi:hypothetical protein